MKWGYFQTIKDEDYGFCDIDSTIGVNIERIYDESEDEDCFIFLFSQSILHETLHLIIAKILFNLYSKGEEEIVEGMVTNE